MRAARFHGQKDLRVEQVAEPQCGPGQVKIAPAFTGICGTDLHEWLGGPNFAPTPENPHPITKESVPITLGHEMSGIVREVGAGVTDRQVGEHVAVKPNLFCGQCGACSSGYENVCDEGLGFVGLSGGGGGFADYVVVPSEMCFFLPSNVPLEFGALVEPLAVAAHAVIASQLQAGDKALVIGGGPIGLSVIQILKARGAGTVIAAEMASARQRFAREFGADHMIDPSKDDVVATARKLCGGVYPDVVFDCAGVPKSLEAACKSVKAGGTVVNLAIWEKPVPFNPTWLVFKEAKYMATLGYNKSDYEYVIGALAAGSMSPERMITKKIKLEDIVGEGFRTLTEDKDHHVKILVDLKA